MSIRKYGKVDRIVIVAVLIFILIILMMINIKIASDNRKNKSPQVFTTSDYQGAGKEKASIEIEPPTFHGPFWDYIKSFSTGQLASMIFNRYNDIKGTCTHVPAMGREYSFAFATGLLIWDYVLDYFEKDKASVGPEMLPIADQLGRAFCGVGPVEWVDGMDNVIRNSNVVTFDEWNTIAELLKAECSDSIVGMEFYKDPSDFTIDEKEAVQQRYDLFVEFKDQAEIRDMFRLYDQLGLNLTAKIPGDAFPEAKEEPEEISENIEDLDLDEILIESKDHKQVLIKKLIWHFSKMDLEDDPLSEEDESEIVDEVYFTSSTLCPSCGQRMLKASTGVNVLISLEKGTQPLRNVLVCRDCKKFITPVRGRKIGDGEYYEYNGEPGYSVMFPTIAKFGTTVAELMAKLKNN